MFKGAIVMWYNHIVQREVGENIVPTRVRFMTYWQQENRNPTLGPFPATLRERYPDVLSVPDAN